MNKTVGGDSSTPRNHSDVCRNSLYQQGQDASKIGNGFCNNYAPYNTDGCCWDGGDCIKVFGDCVASPGTCRVISMA
jgi:hypothetical protein